MSQKRLVRVVTISMMGAVAFLMMYFEFPLPTFPVFLKIDFSEIPALVVGLIFGPWAGVGVEGMKNLIHYMVKGSETGIPIGQLANFAAGGLFVYLVSVLYQKGRNMRGLILGLAVATIAMSALMSISNYYILFPAYAYFLHFPLQEEELLKTVLFGIAPFNLIKGFILSVLTVLLYSKLGDFIREKKAIFSTR
ncbi:ECF transporter S component [Thermicanus aegyptius]|uniref:ECF transporter S component n=1 Tax=Thermicanus aegyptius TaxID=94009 RepID=UPI00041D692B|nr:ECF transporter S component [Thermicanus aegyptius]MBE3554338.1 ECF transporter S component [Thermicanus sp.]